jgi:hypothetical protein
MGDAIDEFNTSFAKEEAEIRGLRGEVAKRKQLVEVKNSEIFTQRKQAENYRSDIITLQARVQATVVLRDKSRKKLDDEAALLEGQQDELNEKTVSLKRLFELESERDEEFIKVVSGINDMQLEARKKVLVALNLFIK